MAFMDWICCPCCSSQNTSLQLYSDATAEAECDDCGAVAEYDLTPALPGHG